ncbi:MAG: MerC domain-containing protein [Alphaproteobacteria bacterium]|nr:MerC domain-containing protein [Alphaproteobacteria bacterium]
MKGTPLLRALLKDGKIDRMAMGLSGLCLAHCLGTAIFVALIASAGSIFLSPMIHEGGLAIAILLGAIALGHGAFVHGFRLPAAVGTLGLGLMTVALALPHGGTEILLTMVGVAILALGHNLNYRASRQAEV